MGEETYKEKSPCISPRSREGPRAGSPDSFGSYGILDFPKGERKCCDQSCQFRVSGKGML
jgi:hypothetical protein